MEAYINLALELAKAGVALEPIAESLIGMMKPNANDPTEADWNALYAIRDAQTADIQAPIPGEETP